MGKGSRHAERAGGFGSALFGYSKKAVNSYIAEADLRHSEAAEAFETEKERLGALLELEKARSEQFEIAAAAEKERASEAEKRLSAEKKRAQEAAAGLKAATERAERLAADLESAKDLLRKSGESLKKAENDLSAKDMSVESERRIAGELRARCSELETELSLAAAAAEKQGERLSAAEREAGLLRGELSARDRDIALLRDRLAAAEKEKAALEDRLSRPGTRVRNAETSGKSSGKAAVRPAKPFFLFGKTGK